MQDVCCAILFPYVYYSTSKLKNQRLAVVYHPQFIAVYHQYGVLYIIIAKENTAYG